MSSLVWQQRITNSIPLGKSVLSISYVSRRFTTICVFLILSVLITQMSQTPALIGMTIAATRVSLFDRLLRLQIPCFLPIPSCHHANQGQSPSSFGAYQSRITDTKQIFEVQLSPNRMEAAVHTSTEDCPPPQNLSYYLPYAVERR